MTAEVVELPVMVEGMHQATALLLRRIETHPEEFAPKGAALPYGGKWTSIIQDFRKAARADDLIVVDRALNDLAMEALYGRIVETLTRAENGTAIGYEASPQTQVLPITQSYYDQNKQLYVDQQLQQLQQLQAYANAQPGQMLPVSSGGIGNTGVGGLFKGLLGGK